MLIGGKKKDKWKKCEKLYKISAYFKKRKLEGGFK
jgi:hypothetical protein